ncbi:hypothetical protein LTSERUB_2429 [Salmonella enterica subsp. enterica serovar Rubislaw str. A4-653]|uniref:Uncharacterized protein n=1 Tax=Salmonella enterica subsp. enterica serovar Rubislaw str. A4-653 TaxID=913081 RepID=G5QIP4_SALRU|nr:hypothetical protein LTSERUB_2429 [Salmonella enterica subsp. enterica serovar Rubislaw str. A4-653]
MCPWREENDDFLPKRRKKLPVNVNEAHKMRALPLDASV